MAFCIIILFDNIIYMQKMSYDIFCIIISFDDIIYMQKMSYDIFCIHT